MASHAGSPARRDPPGTRFTWRRSSFARRNSVACSIRPRTAFCGGTRFNLSGAMNAGRPMHHRLDQSGRPAHRAPSKGGQRACEWKQRPPAQRRTIKERECKKSETARAFQQMHRYALTFEHLPPSITTSSQVYGKLCRPRSSGRLRRRSRLRKNVWPFGYDGHAG
jgi:hypothetical protein